MAFNIEALRKDAMICAVPQKHLWPLQHPQIVALSGSAHQRQTGPMHAAELRRSG